MFGNKYAAVNKEHDIRAAATLLGTPGSDQYLTTVI